MVPVVTPRRTVVVRTRVAEIREGVETGPTPQRFTVSSTVLTLPVTQSPRTPEGRPTVESHKPVLQPSSVEWSGCEPPTWGRPVTPLPRTVTVIG